MTDYIVTHRSVMRKNVREDITFLLMHIGERHERLLRHLSSEDPRLARYYFLALFESIDYGSRGSGLYDYANDVIQLGSAKEINGLQYSPASLEIRLSPKSIYRLREPFRNRIPPLAEYVQLGA